MVYPEDGTFSQNQSTEFMVMVEPIDTEKISDLIQLNLEGYAKDSISV
jgi:hypothetical protein